MLRLASVSTASHVPNNAVVKREHLCHPYWHKQQLHGLLQSIAAAAAITRLFGADLPFDVLRLLPALRLGVAPALVDLVHHECVLPRDARFCVFRNKGIVLL